MRRSLRFLLVAACAAPLAPAWAQAAAPAAAAPAPVTSVEGITEYRLPNGLQVLLVPDASKPTTTVNLTVHVGSRQENYGETGMAHLLEHLLFKGTPTTRAPWAEFSKRGLRANGTTWMDRTNYFASFSARPDTLNWYIGWLGDALVNSYIAAEDLKSEMTVVRNEFEMGENNPGRILFQRTLATMYEWHNYGKNTIGARSDIENVSIANLQAFYRRYYQPDNATLIVAGRFEVNEVLARVAQVFGPLPRPTRVLQPTYTLEAAQDGERVVHLHRTGGPAQVLMGYHVMPAAHPDFGALELVAQVLGDTPGGRIHKRVVEKGLAASAYAFTLGLAEPGALMAGAQLAPGQDPQRARLAMAQVIDGLAAEPITAQELERARAQWLNSWEKGFADPEIIGVALSDAIAQGDWRLYFLSRDHVRKSTLEQVQRVATQWLRPDNRTVGLFEPVTQVQRAPTPAKVDVAALVKGYQGDPNAAAAEAFEATPANLQQRAQNFQLASGLRAVVVPKKTRGGIVHGQLRLRYGDERSLMGQATAKEFAAQLLNRGAAGQTRQQISDRFDQLRAEVSFGASGQHLDVRFNTVRDNLPAVIQQIGLLLRQPSYPAEALEELRQEWLAGLESSRHEPEALVANALQRHGNPYPRGDLRYAASFDEQEQELKALTLAQVREFHRRQYSAQAALFSAVGDLDVAAVRAALDKALGDWKAPAAGPLPYARVPQPLVPVPPKVFELRTPDKKNATFQAELSLPLTDDSPDYPALTLAGRMFGGGTHSRLWIRIREQAGLSYDVGAYIAWNPREANSGWSSHAIFAPENRAKVEAAWREELARSLKDGFTQLELDEARNGLLNARRLQRAQDAAMAGLAAENLDLGRDFLHQQLTDDKLAAVTLAQANAAWRRYIKPEQLVLGWGGDFKPAP